MPPANTTRLARNRVLLTMVVVVLAATACVSDDNEPSGAPFADTATATPPTVSPTPGTTETATASGSPTPAPRSATQGVVTGEDFGTAWRVEVSQRDGEWCMTARADGRSQEVCGEQVALDEVHGGREMVSAVDFDLGTLEITAGIVSEGVTLVRVETAAPPENPGGGTTEEVETVDALVGLNAYAEADQDPTPNQPPELPTVRVVALDLSGDEVGEAEPHDGS